MKKSYNKLATLLGGWFGLHRYMSGEIIMGILYTCTCGLFGIGWAVDIIRAFASIPNHDHSSNRYVPLSSLPVILQLELFYKMAKSATTVGRHTLRRTPQELLVIPRNTLVAVSA